MNPFALYGAYNIGRSIVDTIGGLFNQPQPSYSSAPMASIPASGPGPQYQNDISKNYSSPSNTIPGSGMTTQYAINPYNQTHSVTPGTSSSSSSSQSAPAPSSPSYEEILRRQYQDQLNQANSLFDQRADSLRNQLGDLDRQKGSLLDQISGTYTNVRQQAQDTLTKNLAALDQGKQDVTQGYANLRTEQSRLLGDTQLRNRLLARALGTLNSGFYQNLQSQAAGKTQDNVSRIAQQEQSQLDKIGQEIINQNTDANTKIQGLHEAEAAAKTDILNRYQSLYNQIQSQLSFNGRDRLDAVQALNNQLQNSLDSISMTMAQYRQAASGLGSVTNPLKDITGKTGLIPQLTALNTSILQPIQQNNLLAQAAADLNGGGDLNQIRGYLNRYDIANGTNLLDQFNASTTQVGGLNLPVIGNLGGRPQITNPNSFINSQSLLDQLLAQ